MAVSVIVLTSCAVSYKPIDPVSFSGNHNDTKELDFSYQYDVLAAGKNYRYAKKESRKRFKVIAVQVKNNTLAPINLGKDVLIKYGNTEAIPLKPSGVRKLMKQPAAIYLLYGFLFFYYTKIELHSTANGVYAEPHTTMIPIGLPIAIGNMIFAANANDKFEMELQKYDIVQKTVQPNETVFGIITIKGETNQPLQMILKNESKETIK